MIEPIITKFSNYLERKKENDKFCIYIDFPFCLSNCSYCIYHSLNYYKFRNRIDEYADSVVEQLNNCKELFEMKTPDTLYFGGGTPSLWSPNALERIKTCIPNYENIKIIKAELHPYNLNQEIMDLWIDHMKLDIASIGVQSFDKISCQNQNRIWVSKERIKQIVEYFHKKSVWVNIDLVALFGGDNNENWDVYNDDINIACDEVKCDIITTIPNYKTSLNYYEQVKKMRHILQAKCNGQYLPLYSSMLSDDMEMILQYGKNDHWIATKTYWDFASKNVRYSCSGIAGRSVPKNQITLGFGGCEGHKCYSYLPDNSMRIYSFYDYDDGRYHYLYVES